MKLTKKQLTAAPLCANCHNYVEAPDCRIVQRRRGWVHVVNNSVRCAGQGGDVIFDDHAEPLLSGDTIALRGAARPRAEGGWLSTVGVFTGDTDMLEISKETLHIRENQRIS